MLLLLLLEGGVIGFLMAVPIGAVGILCVRRALHSGRAAAMVVGLAGATADLLFATVSAFSIRLIADFVAGHQYEIRAGGGVLLIAMGLFLFRSHRQTPTSRTAGQGRTQEFLSALVLALTNPLVMFGYGAVISGVGIFQYANDLVALGFVVAGVFLGSLLWFVAISSLAHRFRSRVTVESFSIVNRVAGVLLVLIGANAVWTGLQHVR
jgi:threonine/homoserine/homoserine lactone efflux protein